MLGGVRIRRLAKYVHAAGMDPRESAMFIWIFCKNQWKSLLPCTRFRSSELVSRPRVMFASKVP